MARLIHPEQASRLMIIYGLGYAAVFLIFTLLYRTHEKAKTSNHAPEVFDTRTSMLESGFQFILGVTCASVAAMLPASKGGLSGFLYFIIAVGMTIIGMRRGAAAANSTPP